MILVCKINPYDYAVWKSFDKKILSITKVLKQNSSMTSVILEQAIYIISS